MIPRRFHQIWVGPDPKPTAEFDWWRLQHPEWEYWLWTTPDYEVKPWRCAKQMAVLAEARRWEGVADLMRYEILAEHGGVYLDADLHCVRPLDDWLLDCDAFAVYESEQHRPGMIANGILGARPQHPALLMCVELCEKIQPSFVFAQTKPWQTVGPMLTTKVFTGRSDVTILPSVLFLPQHYLDDAPRQSSLIYATHDWTNTRRDRALVNKEVTHAS